MQNTSEATESAAASILLEMGYSQDMISLALKDAENDSIEHLLDILNSNEVHYRYMIKHSKNPSTLLNKKKPSRKQSDAKKNKEKFKNAENDETNENEKKSSENRNQKSEASKKLNVQSSDNNKENELDQDAEEVEAPKQMDEMSIDYIGSIVQTLESLRSKDPNWLIIELAEQLKSLNFKTSETAARVRKYMEMPEQFKRIGEFKHKVYSTIMKITDMKSVKKRRVDMEQFETAITLAFELGFLKAKQMQAVLTQYPKFCGKLTLKPNEEVLEKLQNYYEEARKNQKNGKEEDAPDVEQEDLEEANGVDSDEKGEGLTEGELLLRQQKEKECCIVCTERFRDVVFMPCCHFLACTLCSPRMVKCPVCNKYIEKNLQIFWS